MALAIAQKPESLSPFQHAEDQRQEKTSLILREIFVIGIPLMATNDLNHVFHLFQMILLQTCFLKRFP